MVGIYCAFRDCYGSTSSKHRFPNPAKDLEMFHKWLDVCSNKALNIKPAAAIFNNYRVCGHHFAENDFGTNKRLLRSAVPKLELPYPKFQLPNFKSQPIEDTSEIKPLKEEVEIALETAAPAPSAIQNSSCKNTPCESINELSPSSKTSGIPVKIQMDYKSRNEDKDLEKYATIVQLPEVVPVVDQSEVEQLSAISFQRNICRTCLRKISTSDSVDIFSDEQFYKGQALIQVFRAITQTLIDPTERLPTNICLKCAQRLKQTVAFKRSIEKADFTLRRKLRLAEMRYHMKKINSITSGLDALCSELVEIEDEFETPIENHTNNEPTVMPTETRKSNIIERKPVDINRLKALQQDIDSIVTGQNSVITKSNNTEKNTNKDINTNAKEIISKCKSASNVINELINKTANTNLSNVIAKSNENQSLQKQEVTIFSGKEFIEKLLNQREAMDMGFDMPKTSKHYSKKYNNVKYGKENPKQNNVIIINEIMDSEMGDTVFLIEDTEDLDHFAEKFQLAQDEPMVIELSDDEEKMCSNKKKDRNAERETHNFPNTNSSMEKENHNPEKKNANIKNNSNVEIEYNLEKKEYSTNKEKHNLDELSGINQSNLLNNQTTCTDDSEKPLACYKCDKKFTKTDLLQRHLLYHSLKLEPTDQTEKHNEKSYGWTMKVSEVFKRAEQISNTIQKVNSDIQEKQDIVLNDHTYDRPMVLTHQQREKELNMCSIDKKFTRIFVDPRIQQIADANEHDYDRPVPLPQRNLEPINYVEEKCKYCNKLMNQYSLRTHILQEHRLQHMTDRKNFIRTRHKCSICQKGHPTLQRLTSHMKAQHEAKYKCSHCDKSFKRKDPLLDHLIISHGVPARAKLCYICGKMIKAVNMGVHIKAHTTVKSIKCTFKGCSAVLKYKNSLRNHIKRVHGNERPFMCERCGMSFAVRQGLWQHMRTHMEVLPYRCEICDRSYALRSLLKKHLPSHQHTKPYSCPVCPQVFSRKNSIKKHCVKYHPEHPLAQQCKRRYYSVKNSEGKTFKCTLCPRKFANGYNLKKHNRTFHPDIYYNLKLAQLNNKATIEEIIHQEKQFLNDFLH